MKRTLFIALLLWSQFLLAQSLEQLDSSVYRFQHNGNLILGLNRLSKIADVDFSYKNAIVTGKRFFLKEDDYSLRDILGEISIQCELQFEALSSSSVSISKAQGFYVYGVLLNSSSSEPISGAYLVIEHKDELIKSDQNGYFRFYTSRKNQNIQVYHADYQILNFDIIPSEGKLNIARLLPISKLKEVKVSENEDARIPLKSYDDINPSRITLPLAGGEADALNVVKLIPGVNSNTFGDQGLAVRGGSPDQNFTLVDGIPVYNTFHLLGLFSIFNSSNINSIRVHKDAFPSKYNNRLSSVLDVRLNNGNKKRLEMQADIGMLSSGLAVSGPIIKDKLSFSVSGRRTYADLLANPIQWISDRESSTRNSNSLWAYDLYGKVHYQVNDKNQISLTMYNGGDQLRLRTRFKADDEENTVEKTEGAIGWRNNLIGVKWLNSLSSKLFLSVEASSSSFSLKFGESYELESESVKKISSSSFSNGLSEQRLSADLDWVWNKNNILKTGLGIVNYEFSPLERSFTSLLDENSLDTTLNYRRIESNEWYAFLENKAYFIGGSISYGLRMSYFLLPQSEYVRFQPKLLLIQNLNKEQQVKFSIASSNQFIHLVPNNTLGMPIDYWLPVTEDIKPMSVTQLSTRYIYKKRNLKAQAGVFSKFYNNILEYEFGTQTLVPGSVQSSLRSGSGRAYGFEGSIKYEIDDLSVYGGYTFSRSKRTIDGINDGEEYFSKYDRPHNISILGEYQFANKNKKLIAAWSYASGNPITVPTARYISEINGQEVIVEEFIKLNNFRLPATHHLDISYVKESVREKFTSTFVLGVYNIYNRFNPYMLYAGIDEAGTPTFKIRSFLPIIPMVRYSVKI